MFSFLQDLFSLLAYISPIFMIVTSLIALVGQIYILRQAKKHQQALAEMEEAQREIIEINEALAQRKLLSGESLDPKIEALKNKIETLKAGENGEPIDVEAIAELEREYVETTIAAERVYGAGSETRQKMADLAERLPPLLAKIRMKNEKIRVIRESMSSPFHLHKVIPLLVDYIGNSEPSKVGGAKTAGKAASK